MADEENKDAVATENSPATEKEKEASKQEEKEQDTTGDTKVSSSKPGSAKLGKSGSAKSVRSTSPSKNTSPKAGRSPKTSARSPSPNAKKKGGKGKKNKQEDHEKLESAEAGDLKEEGGLPEGVIPLFLATKTQELFDIRADEDVTQENPMKFIKREDIVLDMKARAAISDFSPIKQQILDYPEEEILVVYDYEFKHGQNFYVAITEEGKQKLLHPEAAARQTSSGRIPDVDEEEGKEEEEQVIYRYIPPEAKDWISQGSEVEIAEEALVEHRPKIKISVKRIRREFGAPYEFSDRNVADAKDGFVECAPYEDPAFDLKKMELDKGIQAIPNFIDTGCQTDWKHPRNANTQYYPRTFSEEERVERENSKNMANFMKNAAPRFDLSLQQNEIIDAFYDDWMNLGDDGSTFGSKADNHLKEYQSFTDLQFSKDKTITCIDWHPTIKGVVAVAASEKVSFNDRIDRAAEIIMKPSLILIWSFTDPIHPQLLLEAPDDIYAFQFCPTDPNIIAGGCVNGQLVLWDISAHADRLKTQRAKNLKKNTLNSIPGFEDENTLDTPIVRYCAVSSIEHSHKAPISDLLWMPDHLELTRLGVPTENKSGQCVQVLTCAVDHCVLVWDVRKPKGAKEPDKNLKNPMGVPTTFKHLDLSWKPHLKITLSKSEPGGDHSPTKFTIQELQGDRTVLTTLAEDTKPGDKASQQGFSFGSAQTGTVKRSLTNVSTHFFVGTEDGEVVYVDWMPQKDQDTGKIQTSKPDFYHSMHDGPIVMIQRSPFFRDIVLCIGGWCFTVWKEGVASGPILSSAAATSRLTGGHWSPSRPAVFYITRQDGSVDVWDLLDRTHEASMNQSVSAAPITAIVPYQVTAKQHLLAVADNAGTLHILEIPWSLRQPTPNEHTGISNYFDREVKRRAFVVDRWDFREAEKREIEAEVKRKAGIAPNVVLTEEEILQRMRMEYAQFLEEEKIFLRDLGLLKEEEEPLPET